MRVLCLFLLLLVAVQAITRWRHRPQHETDAINISRGRHNQMPLDTTRHREINQSTSRQAPGDEDNVCSEHVHVNEVVLMSSHNYREIFKPKGPWTRVNVRASRKNFLYSVSGGYIAKYSNHVNQIPRRWCLSIGDYMRH